MTRRWGVHGRAASTWLVLLVVVTPSGCAGPSEPDEPTPSGSGSTTASATELTVDEYATALVEGTNAQRRAAGFSPLGDSGCAREQGLRRAEDLAAGGGGLVHAPLDPVEAACGPVTISGENLSRAAASPDDVVQAWMDSPGHASNILMPEYTETGVACVPFDGQDGVEMLCSQVFLGR